MRFALIDQAKKNFPVDRLRITLGVKPERRFRWRENGLEARQKRRFKRTTDSEHAFSGGPQCHRPGFDRDGPNQKWGADISYI